jgi:hypothetical protein
MEKRRDSRPELMGMMPRFYPRNWEMVHKGKRVARKP